MATPDGRNRHLPARQDCNPYRELQQLRVSGTGAPADTLGHDGDFYLDTAAEVLYGPKAGGTWPANGTSLVGPAGPQGPKGDTGAAGPAGPPGPAGTGLSSLDDLNGMPCNNGTGTVHVSYSGLNGPVSIQCGTGANTSPDTAQDMGTISCGSVSSGGTVTATQPEWFKFTFTGCLSLATLQPQPLTIQVAAVSGQAPGTPLMDVFSASDLSNTVFGGPSVTIPGTDTGTFYIRVSPEHGAGTLTYTLTLTAVS